MCTIYADDDDDEDNDSCCTCMSNMLPQLKLCLKPILPRYSLYNAVCTRRAHISGPASECDQEVDTRLV